MFPKHHNDLTVFKNPVYQNCFLNIGGKNFPDENVSTIGARFFENQLTAGDLDAITLSCTKKFEDSMTMPKNDANGKNDTYYHIIEPSGVIVHQPPSQLLFTRETYFKLSLDGLSYHDDESPRGSQANE